MKSIILSLAILCFSACAEYRWASPIAWQAAPELRNVTAKAVSEWQSVSGFVAVEQAGGIVACVPMTPTLPVLEAETARRAAG